MARRKGRGSGRSPARPRTARGRRPSSQRWLARQLKDPYVAAAKDRGYRSRAAFKLIGLDDRFGVLAPGRRVVDLGAAPGGWTQVAVERVGPKGRVVALDISEMEPVPGATVLHGDVDDEATLQRLRDALDGDADVVLSDMAAPATGHGRTDQLRVAALAEAALGLAEALLAPGGAFVCKVLGSGADAELLAAVKGAFAGVRHAKPPASRPESSEVYVVATGFRGRRGGGPDPA